MKSLLSDNMRGFYVGGWGGDADGGVIREERMQEHEREEEVGQRGKLLVFICAAAQHLLDFDYPCCLISFTCFG